MGELHKCATCGAVTKEDGHLCAPVPNLAQCDHCGQSTENARHVCRTKREELDYVCDSCGRLADRADLLCQPAKVPG